MPKTLKEMNNQIKGYINQANGISDKMRQKIVKLVEKHFMVTLPKENFLNIDIVLLENGNIKMRDIEYETGDPVDNLEALNARFELFAEETENLLDKNEVNVDTLIEQKDRNNLVWVIFITFAMIVIVINGIRQLLNGNLFGVLWLIIIIGYYIIPATGSSLRNRYIRAYHYIKSLIYKNKK